MRVVVKSFLLVQSSQSLLGLFLLTSFLAFITVFLLFCGYVLDSGHCRSLHCSVILYFLNIVGL